MGAGKAPVVCSRVRLWGKRLWALCGREGGGHGDRAWTAGGHGDGSPQHHRLKPQMMVWEAGAVSEREASSSLLWEDKQSG